jgi:hypothetical protein
MVFHKRERPCSHPYITKRKLYFYTLFSVLLYTEGEIIKDSELNGRARLQCDSFRVLPERTSPYSLKADMKGGQLG